MVHLTNIKSKMQQRIKTFLEWYQTPEVKFEIIKFLRDRELACLVPSWCPEEMKKKSTRTLRCHSVQHLDTILFKILDVRYKQTLYNLYYSMAKYMNGLPYQDPNLAKRDTREWKDNHHKEMFEYDWLIDIDAGNHDDIDWAFESADKIKRLLDRCSIAYELRFSGCGFHFIVPYRVFAYLNLGFNPLDDNNYYSLLTKMAESMHEKYSEMVDCRLCTPDARRVTKIPYSISFYPNSEYLCLPFINNGEFYKFNLESMRPVNWKGLLRNRPSIVFNLHKTPDFNKLMGLLEVNHDEKV